MVCLSTLLGGCISSVETHVDDDAKRLAPSMAVLIRQVLDLDGANGFGGMLTEDEREILRRSAEAGSISAVDYEASHSRFMTCMDQRGVRPSYEKGPNGVYYLPPYDTRLVTFTDDELFAAQGACLYLHDAVERLYSIQQANPGLYADQYVAGAACLRAGGYVDASYAGKELEAAIDEALDSADPSESFPFDPYEPGANACLRAAGYSLFFWDGPI